MNLAVLLYQYVDSDSKPAGIPDVWPSEVIELGDDTTLPDENWSLMTSEEFAKHLATNQSVYDAWANPPTLNERVGNSINNAADFGASVMHDAAIENVLAGITQAGKTRDFTLYCHKLIHYLETGSLYGALDELNSLLADTSDAKTALSPFLTNDKLNGYKQKILVYLGLA